VSTACTEVPIAASSFDVSASFQGVDADRHHSRQAADDGRVEAPASAGS
jgi:hypothetical protein